MTIPRTRRLTEIIPHAPLPEHPADPRIVAARRHIEAALHTGLTVAELAADAGLSRFHFMRLFAAHTGEQASDYLRRIRLDSAALKLRWTSTPLAVVAAEAGYATQQAFTRAFSARFGTPPARYAKAESLWFTYPTDGLNPRLVSVRKLDAVQCLSRRYTGQYLRGPERWRHFMAALPAELRPGASPALRYISISHDDPRVTPVDELRHTCCVVLPSPFPPMVDSQLRKGFELITTLPGLYAMTTHNGSYHDIGGPYALILDQWLRDRNRYQAYLLRAPPMEFHANPPIEGPEQVFECEIAVPVQPRASRTTRQSSGATSR